MLSGLWLGEQCLAPTSLRDQLCVLTGLGVMLSLCCITSCTIALAFTRPPLLLGQSLLTVLASRGFYLGHWSNQALYMTLSSSW